MVHLSFHSTNSMDIWCHMGLKENQGPAPDELALIPTVSTAFYHLAAYHLTFA